MEREFFTVFQPPKLEAVDFRKPIDPLDVCERTRTVTLKIERLVLGYRANRSVDPREVNYLLEARISRLPAEGALSLPATWKDGLRAELFECLDAWIMDRSRYRLTRRKVRFRLWSLRIEGSLPRPSDYVRNWFVVKSSKYAARLLCVARRRWPVRFKTYHAELYLPYALEVAGLAEEIREDAFGRWRDAS